MGKRKAKVIRMTDPLLDTDAVFLPQVKTVDPVRHAFLARCATAYDAGLCTLDRLKILGRWVEIVMRLEGGQLGYAVEMLQEESERTDRFRSGAVLANDSEGYAAVQLMALLTHHCQKCATDPTAWWTRPGFCQHGTE